MKHDEPVPPRWAETLLGCLVRPSDRDAISGDLLEEFRATQHPRRGPLFASAWYLHQVFSILWQPIAPCVLTLAVLQIVFSVLLSHEAAGTSGIGALVLRGLWYGSPVQAPGISLFDALIYAAAGYRASRRSQLVRTGIVAGGTTSVLSFIALFAAIALANPRLIWAPVSQPFIVVIVVALLSMALACGIVMGGIGGVVGRMSAEGVRPSRV